MDEFNQDRGFFLEKKNKLIVFSLLVFFVVLVYVIKLFSMQVIHGESFRDRAERISQRTKRIVAQRGEIYDRNATVPMVLNIDSFAVDITLGEIPRDEINTVISKLAVLLGVKKEKIEELCTPEFYRSFTPIEVKSNVPYETIAKIAEKVTDLPGVSWKSKPVRSYVDTGSLSHIIGYVGDITKEESAEFVEVTKWYENTCIEKFGAIKFNYIAMMMHDLFVHYHAFPRYDKKVKLFDIEWEDRNPLNCFGSVEDTDDEVLFKIIDYMK